MAKKFRILADSSTDISQAEAKELDVTILGISINFDGEEYFDGVTISKEEFFSKLRTCKQLPKTAAINEFQMLEFFEKEAKEGNEVLYIVISSNMACTTGNAARAYASLDKKLQPFIHIVDSYSVTFQEGALVREAVKMRDKGMSVKDVAAKLEVLKTKMNLWGIVEDLKYLRMGGRISSTSAIVGGMLNVRPILAIKDGKLESAGKVIGHKKAIATLVDYVEKADFDKNYPIYVAHADAPELGKELLDAVVGKLKITNIKMVEIGPTVGTHAGPGCVGICGFKK